MSQYDNARAQAERLLFTSRGGRKPTVAEYNLMDELHNAFVDVAQIIYSDVPEGRDRSIALTALEDAQMRAIRAIFAP